MSVIKNHLLFNHTYLQQLQDDGRIDEEAAAVAQGVRDWYAFCDASSIQTLIDSWVSPMLSILELEIQPLQAPHAHLLYSSWDQQNPVGLCYVTPAGAGLDTTSKGQHWLAQAVLAARRWQNDGQNNSPLRWVILTNGDLWRLLDAHSLRRYEAYLQVDLGQIARGAGDITALRIFYHCFHRHAFVTPILEKPNGLEQLLTASERATGQAEKHLKARVSHNEGIMAQLCLGFVRATGKSSFTEAERDAIYRDATILLYRILFIFYAEARELLPMHNPAYEAVSLSSLVQQAISYQQRGMDNPQATSLWAKLKRLFNAIYASDETLEIPAYNGGLFNDAERPYLGDSTIADAYLSRALYDLACLPGNGNDYQLIDYRDLSVRHLGSLYEGMIEYKLFVAEEPMLARRDSKGNIHYLSQAETGGLRRHDEEIKQGDVYFAQSSGERRATGTYYTPEYIVHYIVEQTVGQGLAERRAALEAKLDNWLAEIAAADPAERPRMRAHVDQELLHFVQEQILTFRVCDPGMGSGHFLVNAAHQITNFIVETLHLTPWANETVNADPVQWRRRVVESCLYGVDINQMAVELAKLSLWLVSMAPNKTLSFLKHHLRQGNSLIGTRLEDLAALLEERKSKRLSRREEKAKAAGQLSLLDELKFNEHVTVARDLMISIATRVTETLADVKAQETDFQQVKAELAPFQTLANLMVAQHFGMALSKHELQTIGKYLFQGTVGTVPQYQRTLDNVQEIAEQHKFFHWQIEFPEVFFNQRKQPDKTSGFDAIIGNPPYDELSEVGLGRPIHEKEYLHSTALYQEAVTYRINLYRLFIALAVNKVKKDGYHGFIVPMSLLGDRFTYELRRKLLENYNFHRIDAFPQKDDPTNRVFFDAKLPTCIYILRHQTPTDAFIVIKHPGKDIQTVTSTYQTTSEEISRFDPENYTIPTVSEQEWDLYKKLATDPTLLPIGQVATPMSGEVIFNKTFRPYLSDSPKYKLVLRGGHVQRYELIDDPRQGTPVYINMEKWLANSQEGSSAFAHTHARVVYQESAALDNWRRIIATYLPAGHVCGHKICYFVDIKYNDLAFLAIFNSSVVEWRFRLVSMTNSLSAYQIKAIPIPKIHFTLDDTGRARLLTKAKHLYDKFLRESNRDGVLEFVSYHLSEGQTEVVHDLLAFLAKQVIDCNKERRALMEKFDLFYFIDLNTSCLKIEQALPALFNSNETLTHLEDIYHDIEGLRLTSGGKGQWLLEIYAKLRDPEQRWREYQRDEEDNLVRQWLPVFRLALDEEVGQFYHYAFANLDGFTGAGKFPGGYTRTTYEKLMTIEVPRYVPIDLTPLVEAEAELAETHRKIELTDKLIDQIVYKLYGLTDDEIAIVEGRV